MSIQGTDGNVFITDDVILRSVMKETKSAMVAVKRMNRQLEKSFSKVGDTLSVTKPFKTKTASGRTLVKQPMTDQKVPFTITNQENWGLEFNQRDRTLSILDFHNKYLKSGARQLGVALERSCLNTMVQKTYNVSGTPGTGLSTDALTDAAGYMSDVGVPDDGLWSALLNTADMRAIDKEMKGVYNEGIVKGAIQSGYKGAIADFDIFKSSIMPVMQVGDYEGSTTPLIKGGSQKGSTIITDGWAVSRTNLLRVGNSITFAGVYEIHPQTRQSTGRLQTFVITAVASSNSSGESTLSISPAINDGTLTTTNAAGQTVSLAAYQNVSNAPADNAAITVIGSPNLYYRQDVCFHRDAFTLVVVPKELPESAPVKARITDEETGLSMSMTADYDITEDNQTYRIDVIWGVDSLQPELAHRIYSAQN